MCLDTGGRGRGQAHGKGNGRRRVQARLSAGTGVAAGRRRAVRARPKVALRCANHKGQAIARSLIWAEPLSENSFCARDWAPGGSLAAAVPPAPGGGRGGANIKVGKLVRPSACEGADCSHPDARTTHCAASHVIAPQGPGPVITSAQSGLALQPNSRHPSDRVTLQLLCI